MHTFDQLCTPENRRRVLNTCFRILGNEADAEDAAQTTFLQAFAHIESYEGRNGAAINTWLLSIAKHSALNHRRSRRETETVSLDHPSPNYVFRGDFDSNAQMTLGDLLPDPNQLSPETLLFFQEVEMMVASLPAELRHPLLLVHEGFSYKEIGLVLGMISIMSVKTTIWRARQAAKSKMVRK